MSAAEFAALAAAVQAKPDAAPLLTKFDTNKDGKIALVEYRAATQANFDRMDTDKDGIVSIAEMKTFGIIKLGDQSVETLSSCKARVHKVL